jgi:hypothetical protein
VADHRHKRDTNARRLPKAHVLAGPIAVVATASTVGLGVLASSPEVRDSFLASSATSISNASTDERPERDVVISRSAPRVDSTRLQLQFGVDMSPAAVREAVRKADEKKWTTVDLNIWTSPGKSAENIGVLDAGEKILVTGRKTSERVEVVLDGKARWVTVGYLSEEKPEPSVTGDVGGTCTNGTSVESGVSPNIAKVHEAVCANFPEITTYGTFRGDGEHAQGLAVDIMVSGDRGWQVAEFVRANASALGVSYVIYSQNIWSVDRGGEGWRGMEDRGSITANHYDHVHVTTY